EGIVSESKNYGDIGWDSRIGGIAGSMSFVLELDPMDFNIEDGLTVNTVLETQAIIQESENVGNILSNNDHVGGIVGNMELGYVYDCVSEGDIESINGNYIGGIAGNSLGIIDASYAKTLLKGGDYIGGIAGYGTDITNSYTLIKIHSSNAYLGAIAGDASENSVIEDNYFVSDVLGAIDGISYANIAEPIEYETLISNEDTPSIFEEFLLTFKRHDKVVKAVKFQYGDAIFKEDMPKLPPRVE